jgi:hypothetical protein
MIFGIPLAIWLGILTFISLFITASFGIAVFKFNKSHLFKYHKAFAFVTVTLAICHLIFAFLLWFKGISI